jgi:Family of unknown function (DUF6055)
VRFLIRWYLGGIVLALGAAPAVAQELGAPAPSAMATAPAGAPLQRLRCGEPATAGFQIQGESRPRLPLTFQTDHFVIYYTVDPTGSHAPALDDTDQDGIPDYIENLGHYFEQAWALYTTPAPDGMEYNPPPLRPGARYPVAVYSLPEGYSGLTWPDSKSGRRATSHITIDSHLYEPYVRQVAAHEFFHAIQFGYNYTASPWWKEASADWAAHQVFPDVDTYIIPYYDWFQVPGWSLDYTDGWHEYADSIFAEQLSETRGRDLIRMIWLDQRGVDNSLAAIEQALESAGTTLKAQFEDFAVWNWFTGDRADGAHYRDGHRIPMLAPDDQSAGTLAPFSGTVQRLGSAYLAIVPDQETAATASAPGRSQTAHTAGVARIAARRRVSGVLKTVPTPAPQTAAQSVVTIKAEDVTALPDARGLTVRLQTENGLDAQLILERADGTHTTVPVAGGRYHVADFEQNYRRAVVVLSNGDTQAKHVFSGSIGLGVVYRDQYGYVWDLELSPTGAVHGTVDVGDRQPWTVQGQISGTSFHWRAVNPKAQNGWATGFDVSGSLANPTGAAIRWTNDSGRSDVWLGVLVDGSAPSPGSIRQRGPAQP